MKQRLFVILTCLVFLAVQGLQAQVRFDKKKLYNVCSVKYPGKAWSYSGSAPNVKLAAVSESDKQQQWSITDLSGSFRLINPFENRAVRAADNALAQVAEVNGSDEMQLWLIKPVGEYVQLIPSNKAQWVASCREDGTIALVDVAKPVRRRKPFSASRQARWLLRLLLPVLHARRCTGKTKPVSRKTRKRAMPLIFLISANRKCWPTRSFTPLRGCTTRARP